MWVGSLLSAGLKIGTIKTYFGYVFVAHPSNACNPVWIEVMSTLVKAHADALVREARRISWRDFHEIISRITVEPIRLAVMMIGVCGLRLADLRRLRRSQIAILVDEIRIRVKISKGRRSASKAKTLRIRNFRSIFHFAVPEQLKSLMSGPPDDRPFGDVSIADMNKALVSASLWCDERPATSYSFRKIYMTTILSYFKWDLEAAKELSMHVSTDSLSGYYDTLI